DFFHKVIIQHTTKFFEEGKYAHIDQRNLQRKKKNNNSVSKCENIVSKELNYKLEYNQSPQMIKQGMQAFLAKTIAKHEFHENTKKYDGLLVASDELLSIMLVHLFFLFKILIKIFQYYLTYVSAVFMFDTFRSLCKLINAFTGNISTVWSIDYSTFDDCQFICSGSYDQTVCIWDVDNNK
ncbi:hypothetical protein RFI_35517, partial [Reticulomyxa filosa]